MWLPGRKGIARTFPLPDRQLGAHIHGADDVIAAKGADLKWLREQLGATHGINKQVLGPEKEDQQQVKVLNQIPTWTESGVEYEADPRHAEIVIEKPGLKGTACRISRNQRRRKHQTGP